MQVRIDIQGIKEFKKGLSELQQRQVPFALSVALNKTLYGGYKAVIHEIADSFDRPTPVVKRAVRYTKSDKRSLWGDVYIPKIVRDVNVHRILRPHIYGGHRRVVKASESGLRRIHIMRPNQYIVPGPGAPLDRYGNISGGQMKKILSAASISESSAGYTSNISARSRKRKGAYKTLYVIPGVGVFKRTGAGTSIPVLFFTDKKPRYEKRFDFYYAVRLHFEQFFDKHMSEAWKYALSTAIAKGR